MTRDSYKSSCGEAVVFELISVIGTKLHRLRVGIFVGGRSLTNAVTYVGLCQRLRCTYYVPKACSSQNSELQVLRVIT